MKRLILLTMLLFSVFTLSACQEKNFTDINNEELKTMLENSEDYQFLDVRTKEEFFAEHVVGFSRYMDFYQFEDDPEKLDEYIELFDLDKNKPLVIMCNSGNRSVDASNMFAAAGFTEVYNLKNGIQGWDGETE